MSKLTPPVEGVDSVTEVRQGLIEYRNAEMMVGAFRRATLLTHAIAWLSVLEDIEKMEYPST